MLTDQSVLNIERWDPKQHDRWGFDCRVKRLNNFLNLSAKKQQKDDMTRVYVAVVPGNTTVLGYQRHQCRNHERRGNGSTTERNT